MSRITVCVHLPSNITLHTIDRPEPCAESPPGRAGAPVLHIKANLWWVVALLLVGAVGVCLASVVADAQTAWPGNVPSLQQVHDQLTKMKAQGKQCEYNEDRAWWAVRAALADQVNADDPARIHPAWEPDMQFANLAACGLLTLTNPPSPPPSPPAACGLFRQM